MATEANDKVVFCDRNHFLYLKGIAIILVVLCHMMGNSGVTWFTPLGGIGVAVFLFCSGYGVYYSLYKNRGVLEETISNSIHRIYTN